MSGDCGESMHRDEHGDLPKVAPRSYPLSGPVPGESPRERLTRGESVGVDDAVFGPIADALEAQGARLAAVLALHQPREIRLYVTATGMPSGTLEVCGHCFDLARAHARRTLDGKAAARLIWPCETAQAAGVEA